MPTFYSVIVSLTNALAPTTRWFRLPAVACSLNQIRKILMETSADNLVIVEDMMTDGFALKNEMDLHSASQVFLTSELNQLPIIDDEGAVISMMKYHEIIQAYDEIVKV